MRKLRTLVFVMTLTLLITGIPLDAFAKEYDLDRNFHEIRTLFNIGDEYDNFDTHQYNYNGKTITDLSWSSKGKNISVRIDQEGNIVGYWKNLHGTDRKKIVYKFPKITRKEGEKIAKDFIKKLYPNILDEIKSRDEDDVYILY
ncbi:MAG: YcdB/YcdC domain-containing protein, partial [Tissierellaceae bacterium]